MGSDRVAPRRDSGGAKAAAAKGIQHISTHCDRHATDPEITFQSQQPRHTDTTPTSIMKVAAVLLAGLGLASAFVSSCLLAGWMGGLIDLMNGTAALCRSIRLPSNTD